MTQQKKEKEEKRKSGAKIDLSAPAAEIQIIMEKTTAPSMQTAHGMESIPKGSCA